jgi:16S rRNA C967 or C1407 C5-methylase (RsmB/RsmF family)
MVSGQENFDSFYQEIYQERWSVLRLALLQPEKQVRQWNSLSELSPEERGLPWLGGCSWHNLKQEIPRTSDGLLAYYVLDPASVICAQALDPSPGQKIFDMCAAPGGKSVVIANGLFAKHDDNSELILNELSSARRERLTKVVQNYIPKRFRPQVWVKGNDGALLAMRMPEHFDGVLLDAPCSGERHLLENLKELNQWKKSRTQNLAQQQYKLLAGAALALKSMGRVVYSTCSISPFENDGVIEKFLKKKGDRFVICPIESIFTHSEIIQWGESTKYGTIFLPDRCGFGPIYFSVLEKSN